MLHAELFHDPASLERGYELIEIIRQCKLRELEIISTAKDTRYEAKQALRDLTREVLVDDGMARSEEDYAAIGRSFVEAKREIDKVKPNFLNGGFTARNAAYGPAQDLLDTYNARAVAVRLIGRNKGQIYRLDGPSWPINRHPKQIGGFVIGLGFMAPTLCIGRRPDTGEVSAQVYTFKSSIAESTVQLAIAE